MISEKKRALQSQKTKRGNVLFLILIAVALFGALSYAVTRMGRTPGNTIGDEKAKLLASQISTQISQMQNSYNRTRLRCPFNQMEYIRNNPNAPLDNSCDFLSFENSGLSDIELPSKALTIKNAYSKWYPNPHVSVPDVGSNAAELGISIKHIDQSVCQQFNLLHLGTSSIWETNNAGGFGGKPWGTFSGNTSVWDYAPSEYSGKYTFCILDTTTPSDYLIYHVFEPK